MRYLIKNQTTKIDSSQCRIEPMEFEDLKEVLKIEKSAFLSPWNGKLFIKALGDPKRDIFLLKKIECAITSVVIGYVCIRRGNNQAHILQFATTPFYRGQGFGLTLLHFTLAYLVEENLRKVFLEVREYNQPAFLLYKQFGFQQIGTIPHYYPDTGEGAFMMERDLSVYVSTRSQHKDYRRMLYEK